MERYNRKRGNMKLAGMLLKNSIPAFYCILFITDYVLTKIDKIHCKNVKVQEEIFCLLMSSILFITIVDEIYWV